MHTYPGGSESFTTLYKKRTAEERVFAYLKEYFEMNKFDACIFRSEFPIHSFLNNVSSRFPFGQFEGNSSIEGIRLAKLWLVMTLRFLD